VEPFAKELLFFPFFGHFLFIFDFHSRFNTLEKIPKKLYEKDLDQETISSER